MHKTKIIGAGSIGNHMAYACRKLDWDVTICDIDEAALDRTKNDIYPSRYGSWDSNIKLALNSEVETENFDVVIIGTPPDTHISIAINELKNSSPKVMLIEKPLSTPELENLNELEELAKSKGTKLCVSYNHTTTANTLFAEELIAKGILGTPKSINVQWLEHWGGIFGAHPWLAGPHDSYLGFYKRGGGSTGEHSHCLNIFQHFSRVLGMGEVTEVTATMDMVDDGQVSYDQNAVIGLKTENGLVGSVITDVLTSPAKKAVRIQGDKGFIEWYVNYKNGFDAVIYQSEGSEIVEKLFEKTRPDDFQNEIEHVGEILSEKIEFQKSPISFETGLQTMKVIQAAYNSAMNKQLVQINQ